MGQNTPRFPSRSSGLTVIPAIPNLNEKTAWAERLKAPTLAPTGLRSSVRFQTTRPGPLLFLLPWNYHFRHEGNCPFPRLLLYYSEYMGKIEILTLGNELLRQKAEAVRLIGPEYHKIASDMIDAMHQGKGVGLAGPQIGLMERIFVVHVEGDIPRVFINPSIIETSPHRVKYEEGCLSVPGIWADVLRPARIRVQAWNERGRPFVLETEGILARVIQHEYDHLEGILFIDRLSKAKQEKLFAKLEKRKQG
jgi:peptide deformylase